MIAAISHINMMFSHVYHDNMWILLYVVVLFGLFIERLLKFIRISRKIKKHSFFPAYKEEITTVYLKTSTLDYSLGQHLVWFIVIAFLSVFEVGIVIFYNLFELVEIYYIAGEFEPYMLSTGLQILVAAEYFVVIRFIVSVCLFLFFNCWKKRLVYTYNLQLFKNYYKKNGV